MDNLATKYRPQTLDEISEQSVTVNILKNICSQEKITHRNFLLIGPAGTGKAQPLDSLVLTVDGYLPMKDISVGTEVFTHNGNIGKVSGIYPQGVRPIYRISLNDGTSIKVSDEHLNLIYTYNKSGNKEYFEFITTDLIKLFKEHPHEVYIDSPIVSWENDELPIDPYVLGAIIMRSSFCNSFSFISINKTFIDSLNSQLQDDWNCKFVPTIHSNLLYHCSGSNLLLDHVRKLGLDVDFEDRFIPSEYLYSSNSNRMSLFQGMVDAIGWQPENEIEWTTIGKQLSEDFAFLVRSLGGIDSITTKSIMDIPTYIHKFNLSQSKLGRYIVDISYVGDEECQCIMVDHEDHTYISDGFIPTHNTTMGRAMANIINDYKGQVIEVDAASYNGVDSVRELVKQMRKYPVGCKYKVFILDEVHSFSNQAWQVLLKPLEDQLANTVIIMCTTNPEKIPVTILSRVQTFQLSKISLNGIIDRLKFIIDEENKSGRNITYTDDAITYIAKLGNGGMRDSITLLEKSLSYSEDIIMENICKALNLPNYDDYFMLLNGIAKKDNKLITSLIDDVYNSGTNFVKWFEGFHSFISNILKYIFMQDIMQTTIPSYYKDKLSNYGTNHAVLCLRLANKLVRLNSELKNTQYQQELAITYLCVEPKLAKKG